MSYSNDNGQKTYTVHVGLLLLTMIFVGLAVQAWRIEVQEPEAEPAGTTTQSTAPVVGYGSDATSITDYFSRLFGPQVVSDNCQVSSGVALGDLMLGINAC